MLVFSQDVKAKNGVKDSYTKTEEEKSDREKREEEEAKQAIDLFEKEHSEEA